MIKPVPINDIAAQFGLTSRTLRYLFNTVRVFNKGCYFVCRRNLLLNLELMKNGYPPIVIRAENRYKYYNALDKAHTVGDNTDFIKIIIDELNKKLDLYLSLIM